MDKAQRELRNAVTQNTVRMVANQIDLNSAHMDVPIALTPTGKRRELLTEANIHLLEAKSKLREALEQE